MRLRASFAALTALLLVGCGPFPEGRGNAVAADRPPDLGVAAGDERVILEPFAYCWTAGSAGICADGEAPDPLSVLTVDGGVGLTVEFPLDWEFQATLLPVGGDACEVATVLMLQPGGPPLVELGAAGRYRADVFGRGEEGDGAWAFELAATTDRPSPPIYVQAYWYPGGENLDPDAPFSLRLENIAAKPEEVFAVARVTASEGGTTELPLDVAPDGGCWRSAIGLEGGADFTARVLELGAAPFSVEITVTIDGEELDLPAISWPDDFPANSDESSRSPIDQQS